MKKLFCAVLLSFAVFASVFAEKSKILSVGVTVPFVDTTAEWENDFADDHEKGKGFGLNFSLRAVNENRISVLFEFDGDYIKFDDMDGLDVALLFGAGFNLSPSDSWKIILSGVVGVDLLGRDETNKAYKTDEDGSESSYDVDNIISLTNFLVGADLYISKRFKTSFGIFAQCTVGVGAGTAINETSWRLSRVNYSESVDGEGEIFFVMPKLGLCWNY